MIYSTAILAIGCLLSLVGCSGAVDEKEANDADPTSKPEVNEPTTSDQDPVPVDDEDPPLTWEQIDVKIEEFNFCTDSEDCTQISTRACGAFGLINRDVDASDLKEEIRRRFNETYGEDVDFGCEAPECEYLRAECVAEKCEVVDSCVE